MSPNGCVQGHDDQAARSGRNRLCDCHAEHQGEHFNATQGALASCTACHNDSNQKLFNGRQVGTPHGGTFGYPVVNGSWSAKSINDEDWDLRKLAVVRLPTDSDQKWRSNQFHALHDQRVRLAPGMKGQRGGTTFMFKLPQLV